VILGYAKEKNQELKDKIKEVRPLVKDHQEELVIKVTKDLNDQVDKEFPVQGA